MLYFPTECSSRVTILHMSWQLSWCGLCTIMSLIVYTFWENWEFVFISIVQFMMSANSRIRFDLQIVFVCLYITPSQYHHCANFIWRHWTYKMPVRYNLLSVWVRLSIFSQLPIIQYVGLCVFSLPISFDWENIYTLSYYHHQIGNMNYYPLFRVRSWNNCMRCMSFYILMAWSNQYFFKSEQYIILTFGWWVFRNSHHKM